MEKREESGYKLELYGREQLQANGIIEVESFDEQEIIAVSKLGVLVIKGEGLHITQLNLEQGEIMLSGNICTLQYAENKKAKMKRKGKGIVEKLLK